MITFFFVFMDIIYKKSHNLFLQWVDHKSNGLNEIQAKWPNCIWVAYFKVWPIKKYELMDWLVGSACFWNLYICRNGIKPFSL
jgi:hypothetical protein